MPWWSYHQTGVSLLVHFVVSVGEVLPYRIRIPTAMVCMRDFACGKRQAESKQIIDKNLRAVGMLINPIFHDNLSGRHGGGRDGLTHYDYGLVLWKCEGGGVNRMNKKSSVRR